MVLEFNRIKKFKNKSYFRDLTDKFFLSLGSLKLQEIRKFENSGIRNFEINQMILICRHRFSITLITVQSKFVQILYTFVHLYTLKFCKKKWKCFFF